MLMKQLNMEQVSLGRKKDEIQPEPPHITLGNSEKDGPRINLRIWGSENGC